MALFETPLPPFPPPPDQRPTLGSLVRDLGLGLRCNSRFGSACRHESLAHIRKHKELGLKEAIEAETSLFQILPGTGPDVQAKLDNGRSKPGLGLVQLIRTNVDLLGLCQEPGDLEQSARFRGLGV